MFVLRRLSAFYNACDVDITVVMSDRHHGCRNEFMNKKNYGLEDLASVRQLPHEHHRDDEDVILDQEPQTPRQQGWRPLFVRGPRPSRQC